MLSNTYLLANIGFDTAENEPAKKLQKTIANFANRSRAHLEAQAGDDAVLRDEGLDVPALHAPARELLHTVPQHPEGGPDLLKPVSPR